MVVRRTENIGTGGRMRAKVDRKWTHPPTAVFRMRKKGRSENAGFGVWVSAAGVEVFSMVLPSTT